MNDVYLYSTKLYSNPLKLSNKAIDGKNFQPEVTLKSFPQNKKIETIIIRDLRMAYGLSYEVDFITKFPNLKIFIVEINDLRGSDRLSFPKIILDITAALSELNHLECIEVGQKSGNTSCTFEDHDIEHDQSVKFLQYFEALLHRNKKLKRVNIFYPLHLFDL